MLPFKTLTPPETVVIAGFSIPKYGSLTVAEERAIRDLDANAANDEALTVLQRDLLLKERVVTILFQSRLDQDWTIENTQAPKWRVLSGTEFIEITPTMAMLDELFQFFMNEQRRWRSPDELVKETSKKKKTGQKSSGKSASPSPTKSDSPPIPLATAQ